MQHEYLRVFGIDEHEPQVSEMEALADGLDRRLQDRIEAQPASDQTADTINDGDAGGAALRCIVGMLEQARQQRPKLTVAIDRLDDRLQVLVLMHQRLDARRVSLSHGLIAPSFRPVDRAFLPRQSYPLPC